MVTDYFALHPTYCCAHQTSFCNRKVFKIPLEKFILHCPRLKSLGLANCEFALPENIKSMTPMPYLTHLCLQIPTSSSNSIYETLLTKCPNLQSLNLFFCFDSSFNYNCVPKSLINLRLFIMPLAAFKKLLKKRGPNLLNLEISHCELSKRSEWDELFALIENCTKLKVLNLRLLTAPVCSISRLPRLKNLEHFVFNDRSISVSNKAIRELLSKNSNLVFIFLNCKTNLSLDELLDICARYCVYVEVFNSLCYQPLNLPNNLRKNMTATGLTTWKTKLKYLRSVNLKTFQQWCDKLNFWFQLSCVLSSD